jgi:hypothetical protein
MPAGFFVRPLEKAHAHRGRSFPARSDADRYAAALHRDGAPCLVCEGGAYGPSVQTGRGAAALEFGAQQSPVGGW